jgi:hypothetical protein
MTLKFSHDIVISFIHRQIAILIITSQQTLFFKVADNALTDFYYQ